ncbi:hypothetical protein G7046_g8933 [Stylonectria norvegica]|nr:hypothetical protein G7046_g8933 [Stylonectria norvegica]
MKSTLFLVGASAMLAAASPIALDKRVMETDWVYDMVTVTVTAGQEPTAAVFLEEPKTTAVAKKHTRRPKPSPVVIKTTIAAPAAEPTTSAAPAPVVIKTTIVQAPEPTTAAPEPTTTAVEEPKTTAVEEPKSTVASVDTTGGDIPLDNYNQVILDHHNIHRTNHSAPDLVWDQTLADYAANTANGCVFAHDMDQGSGGYGQNLASWGTTGSLDGLTNKVAAQGITNQWYNGEMPNWSFYGQDNPPAGMDIDSWGHFTQVVWKSVTKVGCATVQCPAGTVLQYPSLYTVCNYNPPGNYGGEYGANVLEPLGNARVVV